MAWYEAKSGPPVGKYSVSNSLFLQSIFTVVSNQHLLGFYTKPERSGSDKFTAKYSVPKAIEYFEHP